MKIEVSTGIEELKKQFSSSEFLIREDGQGGAYVVMESIYLGPRYQPETTWVGFQIPAQYPYADIYPVFIGAEVCRVDSVEFSPPVTRGHIFENRAAIQVSRRSGSAQNGLQKVTAKLLKVLDFMDKLS